MAVEKISVELKTSTVGGTSDPVYVGIITRDGGREFPLRYEKSGLALADNSKYYFGINNPDLTPQQQIWGSQAGEPNAVDAFPLYKVERVYLRKAPGSASSDDPLGVYHVAVFITDSDGTLIDWSNRNLPDSSGPSPFWLGDAFGQVVYLDPENAT